MKNLTRALFLSLVLTSASQAFSMECGLRGSVAERVADCRVKLGRFARSCIWRGPWDARPGLNGPALIEKAVECDNVVPRSLDPLVSLNARVHRWFLVTRLKSGQEVWLSERRDPHHRKQVIWSDTSPALSLEEARGFCQDPAKGRAEKGYLPLRFSLPTRDFKFCAYQGGQCRYPALGSRELPHDPFRAELDHAWTSGIRTAVPGNFADKLFWVDGYPRRDGAWLMYGSLDASDWNQMEQPGALVVDPARPDARHHARCYALYEAPLPAVSQACKGLELRKVPKGTRCTTSRSVPFELVKRSASGSEVWKDLKTGMLWSDIVEDVPYQTCQTPAAEDAWAGLRNALFYMPNQVDYREAEAHGFREVLPRMVTGLWSDLFRVAAPHYASGWGYVFSGKTGKVEESQLDAGVRCIGL